MNIKIVLLTYASILFLFGLGIGAHSIEPARAVSTWTVDDDDGSADFGSIQEAINAANPGDTIFVFSGTYYEHVVVNKMVLLVGENKTSTVIDCNEISFGLRITASNVTVTGFTVRNSGSGLSGIEVLSSFNNVTGNVVSMNYIGIELMNSSHSVVSDNTVVSNGHRGIYVRAVGGESGNNVIVRNRVLNSSDGINLSWSQNDTVAYNTVSDNLFGIYLAKCRNIRVVGNEVSGGGWGIEFYSSNDSIIVGNGMSNTGFGISLSRCSNIKIYHNNLINTTDRTYIYLSHNITWDSCYPSGGNYWGDYAVVDLFSGPYQNETGSDGIWDRPYTIDENNQDNYPLAGIFSVFNVTWEQQSYDVNVISNSTISDFEFGVIHEPFVNTSKVIIFDVTGGDGTVGFCRVCIPTGLMNGTYKVFVNDMEVLHSLLPCSNSTHNYLYFAYNHSTLEVLIVPEFPIALILPLSLIFTLLAVVLSKGKKYYVHEESIAS